MPLSKLPYLSSGVCGRDRAPQALGAVDHDESSLGRFTNRIQQVRTVVGGVTAAVGLQYDPVHWLQELLDLIRKWISFKHLKLQKVQPKIKLLPLFTKFFLINKEHVHALNEEICQKYVCR